MLTSIFYIVLGVLMWKVFPGMFGSGKGLEVVKSVLRILGIVLIVVGAFQLISYLL